MTETRKSSAARARPLIVHQALAVLFMASIVVLFGAPARAEAATIDLTGDAWSVEGFDDFGNVWDGSTLVIETQDFNGTDYELTGYFDWVGVGPSCPAGCSGRELFTGTLFGDLNLELNGFDLIDPVGIVTASYSAFAFDELTIVNGVWGPLHTPVIPGEWSASRAGAPSEIPLPGAAALFASVLAGAFGWGAVRRRTARSRNAH
ncbi:hypothetical protein [Amphiplicatus metriothermophilus]|uniref:Uncharacterized protein n=1 Tax=Amphiplicatus metriothermophilus TaxID=1519374 RepID=A0A239PMI3_9PROT|nr:hypothetical protein [Amphiplicatus metriothermophilus]MBB5517350.1 hypothetical protein [Amphiplicatus metriothermophilus]SNT68314.1 hypothetical protein SAMN06297382_0816 [Amphiplicatus metriothermophilus]